MMLVQMMLVLEAEWWSLTISKYKKVSILIFVTYD